MFGDWRERIGADKLTERMLQKLHPGEVLLLHDCGTTAGANPDAPRQMLIALERVLEEAKRQGLKSIRVDDMIKAKENAPEKNVSLSKLAIVKLWLVWETVFHKMFRLKTVNPYDPMLHYRIRKYGGQKIELDEGTVLEKGDRVVELHFDNEKLFRFGVRSRSAVHLAIHLIRTMEKELLSACPVHSGGSGGGGCQGAIRRDHGQSRAGAVRVPDRGFEGRALFNLFTALFEIFT